MRSATSCALVVVAWVLFPFAPVEARGDAGTSPGERVIGEFSLESLGAVDRPALSAGVGVLIGGGEGIAPSLLRAPATPQPIMVPTPGTTALVALALLAVVVRRPSHA